MQLPLPDSIITAAQRHPICGIVGSRAVTELVTIAAFMGAAHVLDHKIELKPVKTVLAKVLTPVLGGLDWVTDNAFGALESNEETAARHAMEPSDRAYHYANVLFNSSVRTGLAVGLQTTLMKCFDEQLKISIEGNAPYLKAALWDNGIQLGGGFVFTTVFGKHNEALQDSLQGVMEKAGVPKVHANKLARDAVCMALPNSAGAIASVVSLSRAYAHQNARS
jgi:hypothetical protein